MGVQVKIAGEIYYVESYSVSEDSTPTSSEDSSGSVGSIDLTLVGVEEPFLLEGEEVELIDSRQGTTVGFVSEVRETDNGSSNVTCLSRLGRLNIYDVQAQPFSGTLGDAFRYYASLAGQDTGVFIDDQIANRPVVFPGWYGELWFYIKQMAAAQDCEVALVSNVILLRPLRQREAIDHRNISRNRTYGSHGLARAVEVNVYNNRPIQGELVYPPGGWTPETEVITVGAGEEIERTLELSASISYFEPPVMQTFVAKDYDSSSVYTIVGDDGLPVMPAQWKDYGGRVEISIGEDTTSLLVKVRGAEGIANAKGEAISTFSLALGSDFTGNRYSTLRIIADGVAFDKETLRVRTCIPDKLTGTEVGVTIDNPFLSTYDDAYRAGSRAARWYAGEKMELNGEVTSINRRGESGSASYPTYAFDQAQHEGKTYAQVESEYSGLTYDDIRESYFDIVRDDFDNQVFGNAGGVRIWDRKTLRWYRARRGTIAPDVISFDAEDDLTYFDMELLYGDGTYEDERGYFTGLSYSKRDRKGLFVKDFSHLDGDAFPSELLFPALDLFPQG